MDDALRHREYGLIVAVKVTQHREKNRCSDGFRCKPLQIGKGVCHDSRVLGEQPGQHITLPEHQRKHRAADDQPDAKAGVHRLLGSPLVARADVLCHEGRHRLHERTGDEHGKIDDFARDTVPGRCLQSQSIDEGTECQKGELGQKFLQSQRQPDGQKLAALGIQPHVGSAHRERQVLPPQHDQRTDDTDGLGQHGSQRRARSVQAEPGHEHKVAHDVDNAGDEDENQRRTAVAQAAEHSGQ